MYFDKICDRPASRPTVTQRDIGARSVTLPGMEGSGIQGGWTRVLSGVSEHAELDFEGIRTRGHG